MTTVALATAAVLARLDDDGAPLITALAERGLKAVPAVWNDPAVRWSEFAAVVIRSTWDYSSQRDAFVAWADRAGAETRLFNSAAMVRWNTDKRYLAEVEAAGLAIVPTQFVAPGASCELPSSGEFVIKPTISAGARWSARYAAADSERGATHLRELGAAGRTAMVQPYVASVDTRGENALLFFGGRYSHAIRKGPILKRGADFVKALYAPEFITAADPSTTEIRFAERLVEWTSTRFGTPLYARVDIVAGDDGEPRLIELEATEPSVFLAYDPKAAGRFADAIVQALR